MISSQVGAELDVFVELSLAFYKRLRARKVPLILAWLLTAHFLDANLRVGAALQMAAERQGELAIYPGVRPK